MWRAERRYENPERFLKILAKTHNYEALLHAEHGVAVVQRIALWIQSRCEGVVPGFLEHHMQMVRAHVVPVELEEEFTDRTLEISQWFDKGQRYKPRTSPGIGYATGTTAR